MVPEMSAQIKLARRSIVGSSQFNDEQSHWGAFDIVIVSSRCS